MSTRSITAPEGFDKLLAKNVPLIHEKIILSLDYETFKKCGDVCQVWRGLMASEAFQAKAKSVYWREMKSEQERKLLKAAWLGDIKEVQGLVSQGVSPNYVDRSGRTALWYAKRNGHREVVTMLLDAGANPHLMNIPLFHCNENMVIKVYDSNGKDNTCIHLCHGQYLDHRHHGNLG